MLFRPTVIQLVGVDGATYTLTDADPEEAAILLRKGAKGLDAPEFDVKDDEYVAIDGGYVRSSRATMREVFLPITITARDRHEMMALKRRLIASCNPNRGLVELRSTEFSVPAGFVGEPTAADLVAEPTRSIRGYYAGGLEGGEGSENGITHNTYGLLLRCTDPYFSELARRKQSFLIVETLVPFHNPEVSFLSPDGASPGGFRLSSDPVLNFSADLVNVGDKDAAPRWEIQGPATARFSLVAKDASGTVVRELRMDSAVALTKDEVLLIETARGRQDLRKRSLVDPTVDVSMWWAYDTSSPLWLLEPGVTSVEIVLDKPAGMSPEAELLWALANRPLVSVSFLTSFLGV